MVSLIKNASFYEKSDDNVFHGGHLGIDGSHFENLCPIIFFSTPAFKIYMVSLIKMHRSMRKVTIMYFMAAILELTEVILKICVPSYSLVHPLSKYIWFP